MTTLRYDLDIYSEKRNYRNIRILPVYATYSSIGADGTRTELVDQQKQISSVLTVAVKDELAKKGYKTSIADDSGFDSTESLLRLNRELTTAMNCSHVMLGVDLHSKLTH